MDVVERVRAAVESIPEVRRCCASRSPSLQPFAAIFVMEREPGAWTDFKTQAMLDWWDWAPYARRDQRGGGEAATGGSREWCELTSPSAGS